MARKYGLKKRERVYLRDELNQLFESRTSLFQFPFKLIYKDLPYEEGLPCKFMVSVPKRRHKTAVRRNLLKRRTREAFRLHSALLKATIQEQNLLRSTTSGQRPCTYLLGFIYLSDDVKSYAYIEKAMISLLTQLSNKLTQVCEANHSTESAERSNV